MENETTSLQRRMLVRFLESDKDLARYTLTFKEAIRRMKIITISLNRLGSDHSIEFWCRFWNHWQLHVLEKGLQNLDQVDDLENRVYILVDEINKDIFNPFSIKDSPLMKLRQDLLDSELQQALTANGYEMVQIIDNPEIEVPQNQEDLNVEAEVVDLTINPEPDNDEAEQEWPSFLDRIKFSDYNGEISIIDDDSFYK